MLNLGKTSSVLTMVDFLVLNTAAKGNSKNIVMKKATVYVKPMVPKAKYI